MEQELRIRERPSSRGRGYDWEWEAKTFDPALVWAEDPAKTVTYGRSNTRNEAIAEVQAAAKRHLAGDGWESVDPLP